MSILKVKNHLYRIFVANLFVLSGSLNMQDENTKFVTLDRVGLLEPWLSKPEVFGTGDVRKLLSIGNHLPYMNQKPPIFWQDENFFQPNQCDWLTKLSKTQFIQFTLYATFRRSLFYVCVSNRISYRIGYILAAFVFTNWPKISRISFLVILLFLVSHFLYR